VSDLLIVVPAFNEAATIADIVERARLHGPVVVVDDGSTDDTAARAAAAGAEVIALGARRGKGAALRRGFAEAERRGAARVVTLDGDGQHEPDEIPRLLKVAIEEPDALVIGGRLAGLTEAPPRVIPVGRLAALRVAGFFIDWLSGAPVADTQSGFRVYPASLLAVVRPRRGGFVLETEMLLRAADRGVALREVPVTPIHFEDRRSRFRPARDGLAVGAYLAGRIVSRWAREAAAGAAWLVGIFSPRRLRARHREMYQFAAPQRSNLPGWALAVGAFVADRALRNAERGWRSDHARGLRLAAVATAATPLLLGLALGRSALARVGIDWLSPVVRRLYPQEALAATLEAPARRAAAAAAARPAHNAVRVGGGGPGGASAATFLSRGGLRVALAEREAFPRFHVGESLLPANMPVLERLGVLDAVKARGFLVKYGAYFHDQDMDIGYQFFFREGKPWPSYTYEVQRGEFDQILLDHAARQPNVTLLQPATVERVAFDAEGATVTVAEAAGSREIRARFLVDASGRDAFIASRHGRRRPIEGLGKVALFAHFQGGKRWPGKEAGNIRIFTFEPGWFWYIPFHNGTSSVGCVLHARTVQGREGNLEQLYESLIGRCRGLLDALDGAPRITPVHSAANFSYQTEPAVGDRYVCVGDAIAFLDPIFSSGVYLATQSAELSSAEILKAFRENRFEARRFRGYQKAIRRGMQPFQRFIRNFYDPSFTEMFLKPREFAGMVDGVTGVLAGGAFLRMSLRMRLSLEVFFTIVRINRWVRRRRGLTTESRYKW
jgi:2-polyprenyl-6-methoxyphenol hydroxylase-like FAD-dependent oxidoreductase/glycosyltransferase involved in cell wall biosynthesis